MFASPHRPRLPAGPRSVGRWPSEELRGLAGRWRRRGRRAGILAAGGLILCLGSSCASRSGQKTKEPSSAIAARSPASATPAPTAAAAAVANHGGDTAAVGPVAHYFTSAHVENDAGGQAPSPGRELLAPAPSGAGSAPAEARAGTAEGNGVPAAAAERRVGVVRVIGAHGKFVLIETTGGSSGGSLAEGQELRCRGPVATGGAQTAVLKVAREREEPFLVADVLSGEPQAGDIAYLALEKKSGTGRSR